MSDERMEMVLQSLGRIEERQISTKELLQANIETVKTHDTRIKKIEVKMPMLNMVKGWIIGGVIGCVGLVGLAAAHLVLK